MFVCMCVCVCVYNMNICNVCVCPETRKCEAESVRRDRRAARNEIYVCLYVCVCVCVCII